MRIATDTGFRKVLGADPRPVRPDPKPPRGSKKRTHCPKGHPYEGGNTYVNPRGAQECMECRREKNRQYKDRLRARGLKPNRGKRKPKVAAAYRCVECGKERVLLNPPQSPRCSSCSMILSQGNGEYIVCPCGTRFYAKRRRVATAKFCSMGCKSKYGNPEIAAQYRVARLGEGNPNFRHGRRTDIHLSGWSVRHKGEKCCRNCGERGILHLHHVIPRSKFRAGRAELRNGIVLCFACHSGWHGKRVVLYRDLFTPDEWAYLTSVELTGENVGPWLDKHYPERPQEEAA